MIERLLNISIPMKMALGAVLLLAAWGGWEVFKQSLRNEGAASLSDKLRDNDTKTLKQKVQNDAELGAKSDDDLILEFKPDGVR